MARSGLVLLGLLLLAAAATAADPPPIMPVSEVKRGMKGYGKSVFQGTTIERFDVEVVDVLRRALPQIDLILIRVSHPVVDKANVIGGMSGSPIYLEDKLVGALAYGWSFSKEPIAGVTPIEAMLAEAKRPILKTGALDRHDLPPGIEPCVTPLALAGFSARGTRYLAEHLREFGIEPMQGSGGAETEGPEITLEPGSAIGVTLIRGDLNATATGTVTWVDGDTVLAFGHPFLGGGQSEMPITTAVVHMVLVSMARSFKLSSPVRAVGTMIQDRNPCILGRLGAVPPMVPVQVRLKNAETGYATSFRYEVVRHPFFTPMLINSVLMESVDAGEGQLGESTVTADLTVKLEGMEPFTWREVLANPAQVFHPGMINDLVQLQQSQLERVLVERVDAALSVENGNRGAVIERAWLDRERARPGEKVGLTVQMRRFRREVVTRTVAVEVPADQPEGPMEIVVTSRPEAPIDLPPANSAKEMVAWILARPSATALVIHLPTRSLDLRVAGKVLPDMPNSALGSWVPSIKAPADLAQGTHRQLEETPYVLSGTARATLTVRK